MERDMKREAEIEVTITGNGVRRKRLSNAGINKRRKKESPKGKRESKRNIRRKMLIKRRITGNWVRRKKLHQ